MGNSSYHIWLTFACTLLHKTHNFRRLPPQSILRSMSACTISLKFQFRKQFFLLTSSELFKAIVRTFDKRRWPALLRSSSACPLVSWASSLNSARAYRSASSTHFGQVVSRNLPESTVPTQHPTHAANPCDVHCQIPGLNTETRRRPFPGGSTHKPRPYALRTSREWRAR